MIRRTMDAVFLNDLANDPCVRPWLGGEGELDLAPMITDLRNVAIRTDHGAWVFHNLGAGTYEVHTMFRPAGRGKALLAAAKDALTYLFSTTDAVDIVTKCPDDNEPARLASAQIGFKERFRRDNAWSDGVGISYRGLSIVDWAFGSSDCLTAGRDFHDKIAAAKVAAGTEDTIHAADEAHDRMAGAASLLVLAGNTEKGVSFYNHWAIFAGYAAVEAISRTIIDIRDAVVEVRAGKMEVVLCR